LSPFLFANKNGFLLRQGCGGQAGTWIALASLTHIASRRRTTLTGNLVIFLLHKKKRARLHEPANPSLVTIFICQ